jgi:hypothetical protein
MMVRLLVIGDKENDGDGKRGNIYSKISPSQIGPSRYLAFHLMVAGISSK